MVCDIASIITEVLCKNKNTGELSICSAFCKNITEKKIKGVCVCDPVGECGNDLCCKLNKEGFEKLDSIQRRFTMVGKEFYRINHNGFEILDALPLVKGDRLVIPNGVESFSSDAEKNIPAIKYLEVPPTLTNVDNFIFHHSNELVELTFSEGVKELLLCTLPHYKNLKKIYLPRSLEKIDDGELFADLIKTLFEGKTFYVHKDSYAEEYMKNEGLSYEVI